VLLGAVLDEDPAETAVTDALLEHVDIAAELATLVDGLSPRAYRRTRLASFEPNAAVVIRWPRLSKSQRAIADGDSRPRRDTPSLPAART